MGAPKEGREVPNEGKGVPRECSGETTTVSGAPTSYSEAPGCEAAGLTLRGARLSGLRKDRSYSAGRDLKWWKKGNQSVGNALETP